MKTLRTAGVVALAMLAGACGKSSSKDPLTLDNFPARAADMYCSTLVTCGCTDAIAVEDCKAAYTDILATILDESQTRFLGRTFDRTAGQTCLDAIQTKANGCPSPTWNTMGPSLVTRSGPSLPALPEECQSLFVGTQTVGDYCGSWSDCAKGLYCNDSTTKCAALPGDGEDCTQSRECKDGFYCASLVTGTGVGIVPAGYVCKAVPGKNQPCGQYRNCAAGLYCDTASTTCLEFPAADQACGSGYSPARGTGNQCAVGLTCVGNVEAGYLCKAPHAVGQDCADGAGCVADAYCDTYGGVSTPATNKCASFAQDGGECVSDVQCLHTQCGPDHKCYDPGFCSMIDNSRR